MSGMDVVVLGLSITSSWGNGHATTYRALLRELAARGHQLTFLERDVEWYANHRDLPEPDFCRTELYEDLEDLKDRFATDVREADVVIVGSYVPQGIDVGTWALEIARGVVAFYDIDTPVTLGKLERGDSEYIHPDLIAQYDLYLSFSGGPALEILEKEYGSPRARALYCSVDPTAYFPEVLHERYDLGYMGTYSDDRQPPLERLMLDAARQWKQGRFVVAGPQYPDTIEWPENVNRIEHLPPHEHRAFYNSQRFTLNITRADMVRLGHSPSVRLFEAAACGVPIISDYWDGLDELFTFDREILVCRSAADTLRYLREMSDEDARCLGVAARERVLGQHTAAHRAEELETFLTQAIEVHPPSASISEGT